MIGGEERDADAEEGEGVNDGWGLMRKAWEAMCRWEVCATRDEHRTSVLDRKVTY
jgi:hypothetical protein